MTKKYLLYEKLIITDWEEIDGEMFPIEYEWVKTKHRRLCRKLYIIGLYKSF